MVERSFILGEQEYLLQRLDDQINWYDRKSMWNQQMYKVLKWLELVLSASIPIMVPFASRYTIVGIIVAACGALITAITGIHGLYNFHENWIQYRMTSETLKHEKFLYLTRSGAYYEVENPFKLLVERTETIISHENINWSQMSNPKDRSNSAHDDFSKSTSSSTGS